MTIQIELGYSVDKSAISHIVIQIKERERERERLTYWMFHFAFF